MVIDNDILTKTLYVGETKFNVQFNKARVRSSAAKTDADSIAKRPCFLCKENRPPEQPSKDWRSRYEILENPFPIFPKHLTIPTYEHIPQQIEGKFADMLALAVDFPELTIFFNGARCGASAPDHMHFQAGSRLFMPIEQQWQERIGEHLAVVGQARLHIMENDPRNTLVMISNKADDAVKLLEKILWALSWVQTTSLNDIQSMREGEICGECLPQTWKLKGVELPQSGRIIEQNKLSAVLCNEGSESQEEPNVNVLCYYENRQWFTFIFPRTRHRPSCYFSEGDEQMIISPASVDLGGVFITVRESDFKHLDATRLENILHEVCWQEQEIKVFKDSLKSNGTTK